MCIALDGSAKDTDKKMINEEYPLGLLWRVKECIYVIQDNNAIRRKVVDL